MAGSRLDSDEMNLSGSALSASLTVNDINTSLAWYRDVLGFSVDQKFEREGKLMAVSLKAGEARILITQDDFSRGRDREKGLGFSMMITTSQNIDGLAEGIKSRGGALDSEPFDSPWGQRAFRLHDPDGFRFAISSERKR
jgi:uncharacterized glyoxalase superfamily protein PhnB